MSTAKRFTIALAGNPNCGKTTLFNALTGSRQHVGNWAGVTVEKKSGELRHGGSIYEVVDLPGTYALNTGTAGGVDEQIARGFLASGQADLIVNVVDASALERGLYLTSELLDCGLPVVVALNMIDVAHEHGVHIDPAALAEQLGVPVVPVVASRSEGVHTLIDVIERTLHDADAGSKAGAAPLPLPAHLESRLGDGNRLAAVQAHAGADPAFASALTAARYERIDAIVAAVSHRTPVARTRTDLIDAVVLNRWLGVPVFVAVMYLLFLISINLGGAFIDFFDIAGAALFVETPRLALTAIGAPDWLTVLLADGVGGGIQLVGTFIPVIGGLFLCLAFLEDSGYMARAAFVIDRGMRAIGLPGKAFVPLIVGFGCNVPAVMAARTLDRPQDRLLTVLMAPYMSCGARLTVYALFATAFFSSGAQNVVFALYLIGIAVAVLTALLLRRFVLGWTETSFVLELPAYHLPTLRALLLQTWHRLRDFVLRAGKAIVTVVVVLNVLNSIGTDGSFGNENSQNSALSAIGRQITPVFAPIGIREDNWPATVGLFTGFFAKEVVVGTLDALYGEMAAAGTDDDSAFSLTGALTEALASIPANIADLAGALTDPLGIDLGDTDDPVAAAAAQGVQVTTVGLMQSLFATTGAAFAYLVFVLLYAPCVATVGVIYREQGGFWALFSVLWSFGAAYAIATVCYQATLLASAPLAALVWIVGALAGMAAGAWLMARWATRQVRRSGLIPVVQVR